MINELVPLDKIQAFKYKYKHEPIFIFNEIQNQS